MRGRRQRPPSPRPRPRGAPGGGGGGEGPAATAPRRAWPARREGGSRPTIARWWAGHRVASCRAAPATVGADGGGYMPIAGSPATVRLVRDGEWVRFVIRFEVLDAERFREMAAAMVAVSRDEPGTVVYDWYLDEAAAKGTLYEAYSSAEALEAHGSGAVFTDLASALPRRHPSRVGGCVRGGRGDASARRPRRTHDVVGCTDRRGHRRGLNGIAGLRLGRGARGRRPTRRTGSRPAVSARRRG